MCSSQASSVPYLPTSSAMFAAIMPSPELCAAVRAFDFDLFPPMRPPFDGEIAARGPVINPARLTHL